MGTDLVSACIFCAGLVLGMDLSPRDGLGGEMGFSYATLARRFPVLGDGTDTSDVTPKFVLIGLGNARQPANGLGAGTPAFQWAFRVAFATSHDEQFRGDINSRVIATGTGRYENFALLGRIPVGAADSLELGINRRAESATDLVNLGGGDRAFSEQRSLSASRADLALGWRHRWKGLEAQAAFRWTKPDGYNATARYSLNASGGGLFGGEAEVRWRSGPWTALLHGEAIGGSLSLRRSHYPFEQVREDSLPASFSAVRGGVGYSWPCTELFLTATYDTQKLPFVSLAVLGEETMALDGGFDASSLNKEIYTNLAFRYRINPTIAVRVGLVLAWGDETVTLADPVGSQPSRQIDVMRRGVFGGGLSSAIGQPELALYIGADFSIGAPPSTPGR